jgi:pyruvate-ferredoxin/flavodoxin oxidoreductase
VRIYSSVVPERKILDGNEAVASVAHRSSEVIAIYPITPASPMGELADQWSMEGRTNVWGVVPDVMEMQSEGGAAGAVHGALQAGSLTTTFTASQGLLLMLPNLYKIAGELTSSVIHVAARTVATHALSIFGDHSDVMACRQAGLAMLASASPQQAHDFAAIAQAATLKARVPFIHFMDGFRTSHELAEAELLSDRQLKDLYDPEDVRAHRERALTPDRPVLRGTAQNPDVFFQAREAANPFYEACADRVVEAMERFAEQTGRQYAPFEYVGHPEAERVVVLMGSATETAHATVEHLAARGERVGAVKVRLYRPFDVARFVSTLPSTVQGLAVLDRTKEPGATGEPLYLDVAAALMEAHADGTAPFVRIPRVLGGRYGLSSKELTPAMVRGVLEHLGKERPHNHFTVGIVDDVTGRSIGYDPEVDVEPRGTVRALFYGLGSDGTVSSNKNTIKIIGTETNLHAQGYFVYDSKKAGATTVSHLRFGPEPIRAPYLIEEAEFVACHQEQLLDRLPVLEHAARGAKVLLNTSTPAEQVWDGLSQELQRIVVDRELHLFAIDGYAVAESAGLGRRLSTVMQTCFFALAGVLGRDEAIAHVKKAAASSYGKRGDEIVRRNHAAIDAALSHLHEIDVPREVTATRNRPPPVPERAPEFVQRVTAAMMEGHGDRLPVSAFPPDGTWPLGTSQWEKRAIAREIPIWDPAICIQCNKCVNMCPHATIRATVYEPSQLQSAPITFQAMDAKSGLVDGPGTGQKYTVQVAPDDCTGCGLCVAVCPAKDKSNPRHKAIDMMPVESHRERERANWDFFTSLAPVDRRKVHLNVKGSQLLEPLFEFSGACSGCGETPYIKLLTQLFGDRMLIANATGCSSIFGGNLPTTPYRTNAEGRGPAWSNSLFEDNAEFGFGMRLAADHGARYARTLLAQLREDVGAELADAILAAQNRDEPSVQEQRARVHELRTRLAALGAEPARRLEEVADFLVPKSVWLVGGDGWAYDIGYGGLDHVLATDRNINVLVLDTEVYSNTGGQQSKATPIGAAAKFAAAGKEIAKKDLGLLAMAYGHVYVARVAMGARDAQTLRALQEAEAYPGPSLIIAYSHCIAHGYDLSHGAEQQKLAVDSGVWPLYRFDPERFDRGEAPLQLDSPRLKASVREYMKNEGRFRMVQLRDPKRYERLVARAEEHVRRQHAVYEQLAGVRVDASDGSRDHDGAAE